MSEIHIEQLYLRLNRHGEAIDRLAVRLNAHAEDISELIGCIEDIAELTSRMGELTERVSAAAQARGFAEAERDKLNVRIGRLERLLERED